MKHFYKHHKAVKSASHHVYTAPEYSSSWETSCKCSAFYFAFSQLKVFTFFIFQLKVNIFETRFFLLFSDQINNTFQF